MLGFGVPNRSRLGDNRGMTITYKDAEGVTGMRVAGRQIGRAHV